MFKTVFLCLLVVSSIAYAAAGNTRLYDMNRQKVKSKQTKQVAEAQTSNARVYYKAPSEVPKSIESHVNDVEAEDDEDF